MKRLAVVAWVMAFSSGTYLMIAHLFGEGFKWSWQGECMESVLVISLVAAFGITIGLLEIKREKEER